VQKVPTKVPTKGNRNGPRKNLHSTGQAQRIVRWDKYSDGQGMYLLVKGTSKYWRMSYRFDGKQKTLAFGVYPAVSLAQARGRRDEARKALAEGIDPGQAKLEAKAAKEAETANTFEALARERLKKVSKSRSASTQDKVTAWLEHDVFQFVGHMPVSQVPSGAKAGARIDSLCGHRGCAPVRRLLPGGGKSAPRDHAPFELAAFAAKKIAAGDKKNVVAGRLGLHPSALTHLLCLAGDVPAFMLELYHGNKCRSTRYPHQLRGFWEAAPRWSRRARPPARSTSGLSNHWRMR
jgi:hypothetical protein